MRNAFLPADKDRMKGHAEIIHLVVVY